jgi:hypothetical protein
MPSRTRWGQTAGWGSWHEVAADANKQRSIPGKDWDKKRDAETASRAVKEYLATLDDVALGAASDVVRSSSPRQIRRRSGRVR